MKRVTILLLLLNVVGNSQILIKKTDQKKSSLNEISNIYVDEDNVYYTKLLDEKYDKSSYSLNRKYTIRTSLGKEIILADNEAVISVKKNNLYTAMEDAERGEKTYFVNSIDKKGILTKKAKLKLSLTSSATVLKNGNVIIAEGGHGGTDWIALYSKELKLIHQFMPFSDVFDLAYGSNENYIAYVAQKQKGTQIRIGLHSYLGNKALIGSKEIEIDSNYVISSAKVEGTKILILLANVKNSQSRIIVLDNKLEVLNKLDFQYRVSYNKLISSNDKLYLNFANKIIAYNLNSKSQLWEVSKSNISVTKSDKGYRFRGGELDILDDKLILLAGTYTDGETEIENVEISVLNTLDGKSQQTIKLGNFNNEIKRYIYKRSLFLVQNGKPIVYEKK